MKTQLKWKLIENAFKNSISENNLNFSVEVTSELKLIKNSDLLVLPGVGSFPDCKEGLQKIQGLIDVLFDEVIIKNKLFLGICVGMQLMAEYSLEKVNTDGFGWFKGNIEKINNNGTDYLGRNYKIPHMGWNNLEISEETFMSPFSFSSIPVFLISFSKILVINLATKIPMIRTPIPPRIFITESVNPNLERKPEMLDAKLVDVSDKVCVCNKIVNCVIVIFFWKKSKEYATFNKF